MADWLATQTGFAFKFWRGTWDSSTGYDLTGKVAVVTGGNTGLGYITCRELLKKGATVYMASRSQERANSAISKLTEEVPDSASKLKYLSFDMTDIASAQKAAQTIIDKEERLDIVIANAGVMAWPYKIVNGIEVQAWNHFGHFALIEPLLPLLKKTAALPESHVRIVNVSSLAHTFSPKPDLSSLEAVNSEMGGTWKRYGASKLYNVLYTHNLAKRLAGTGIRVLTLHPGNVDTELQRGPAESYKVLGRVMTFMSRYIAMTPFEGAKTQLFAAYSEVVDEKDLQAAYLSPVGFVGKATKYGTNPEYADQLYELSKKAIAELGPK